MERQGLKELRPSGFEPLTYRLEGGCSIQLSYGRLSNGNTDCLINPTGCKNDGFSQNYTGDYTPEDCGTWR